MSRALRSSAWLPFLAMASLGGCNLFNTEGTEGGIGRGSKLFDPYQGLQSGAVRLNLSFVNGCAYDSRGFHFTKGSAKIPYPDTCERFTYTPNVPDPKTGPMPLVAGTNYFLNQLAFVEYAEAKHNDPTKLYEYVNWVKNETVFKKLDWRNFGVISDWWTVSEAVVNPNAFDHYVFYGNANWQLDTSDTFTLEILDADGNVRQTAEYKRSDFLGENPVLHSRFAWRAVDIAPPRYPSDVEIRQADPPPPGFPPGGSPTTTSMANFSVGTSSRPTKSFRLDPGLVGDGAIRVTWSKLPDDPFYAPVTFVPEANLPQTCYSGSDSTQRVACTFGAFPEVKLSPPASGSVYMPGETVKLTLAIKDGNGNYIHNPDFFPSWNEIFEDKANGFKALHPFPYDVLNQRESGTGWQVSGPKQNMRLGYDLNGIPYFLGPTQQLIPGVGNLGGNFVVGDGLFFAGSDGAFPGIRDVQTPTTSTFTIPTTAEAGTYVIYFKTHRFFYGEQFNRMITQEFQVGTDKKTEFPGRVGNCQICHRGTLSLDNVHHGLSVDYIEGCKTCHGRDTFGGGRVYLPSVLHRVHMMSTKYPQPKNDCTFCHLSKESATRPSYEVCASCHPAIHGTTFWNQSMESGYMINQDGPFGNCADQCHRQTTPKTHILPGQE